MELVWNVGSPLNNEVESIKEREYDLQDGAFEVNLAILRAVVFMTLSMW